MPDQDRGMELIHLARRPDSRERRGLHASHAIRGRCIADQLGTRAPFAIATRSRSATGSATTCETLAPFGTPTISSWRGSMFRAAGCGTSEAIRPLKFVSLDEQVPAAIVLVTDERSAGSTSNPWEDLVDIPHGRIVYWGDAKFDARRTVDDFAGNRALSQGLNQVLDRSSNGPDSADPPLQQAPRTGLFEYNGLCMIGSNSRGLRTTAGQSGTTAPTSPFSIRSMSTSAGSKAG